MNAHVSARSGAGILALALAACGGAGAPPANAAAERAAAVSARPAQAWVPPAGDTFAVQYTGKLDLGVDADAFDLDGFDTKASIVEKLHAAQRHAVCYIDVGTWENWRPDAQQFPKSVLGKPDGGWKGERWLDIRALSVLEPIMTARFAMCASKGFDAVDPDNIDGYENRTGFPLTAKDQLAYDRWVAGAVHAAGLSVAQKNDGDQIGQLDGDFDFAVTEQCYKYTFCDRFAPYVSRGALVVDIEYGMKQDAFQNDACPVVQGDGETALLKHLRLDAWVVTCR